MGKALNGLVNRNEENREERNVIRLESVDVLHPKGSRVRAVIKNKKRNPHTKVVTKVREVTYLYDKDVVTKGFEIVEEHSVSIKSQYGLFVEPEVVDHVTRDYRTNLETPK